MDSALSRNRTASDGDRNGRDDTRPSGFFMCRARKFAREAENSGRTGMADKTIDRT